MKKNNFILLKFAFAGLLVLFISPTIMGQVGIGTFTPEGVLDVNSDTGNKYGLVLPRVELVRTDRATPVVDPNTGAAIASQHVGTVVYNTKTTSNGRLSVYPGVYMWDGEEWINEFPKKDAEIFRQTPPLTALRIQTSGGFVDIPGLKDRTFEPEYSGTYKIEVSVNYGGGIVDDGGAGTDIGIAKGNFKFTFDAANDPNPDHITPVKAISTRISGSSTYFDIWEQTTFVVYKELMANTVYDFNLSFDQTETDGFIGGGDLSGTDNTGLGWLGGDIPCSVEFVFLD